MELPASNFPSLFFEEVAVRKTRVALRHKKFGIWNRISWQEYGDKVKTVAAGLRSFGLQPGDRVAILGDNRPEWLICHLAIMTIACATCGIYSTSSSEEVAYILGHSESELLFVENEEQVDKILHIQSGINLQQVVVWDPKGLWGFSHPKFIYFDEFLRKGKSFEEAHPDDVTRCMQTIKPDQTAMIIYTSGTTGPPKGARITHGNVMSIIDSFMGSTPIYQSDELISYLPLAHIYENLISVFNAIKSGGTVNFVESMDTLSQNLREVSPTVFASVPRIWEKFASAIDIRMSDSTYLKRIFYRLAIRVGLQRGQTLKNTTKRIFWNILYYPFYLLVLYPLKRQIGFDRLRMALCAAAPASPELFEYWNAIGVPLIEGYGQTESTGVIAVQQKRQRPHGFIGEPAPGVEVRIAEDGEILVRGPGVFGGYLKDPDLTASTIRDGWLYTGDTGVMEDNFLKIVGRKKDIIITAGGKNITPDFIENKLKFSNYIQDAVVIGDGRKYVVALILIDEDTVTKYAQDKRIPFTTFEDLTQNIEIKKLIGGEVSKVNKMLSKVEGIKKFALLPRRFYEEDGDVTPTKKVKRRFLERTL